MTAYTAHSSLRRLSAVAALVAAVITMTSGCLMLPPMPQQVPTAPTTPVTQPPAPPVVSTAPPAPTPITPSTPSPAPEPEEPEEPEDASASGTPTEPSGPIGQLWGGNSAASESGLSTDDPSAYVIPPTYGSADVAAGSPWNDASAGDTFRADQDPATANDLLLATTGRIYITYENGMTSTCTATVINSATDNIAVTAAHCLYHTIEHTMAAEVTFVPGDANDGSSAPFGAWEAERWWMPQVFIDTATATADTSNGDGWAWDYGYLRFSPASDGREIEQVTGGQGISFRGETNGVLVLGYPVDAPFDGQSLRYCSSNQVGFGTNYWPHFGITCEMTGGMSGGPWITDVDQATGAGYIVSVSSTIPPGVATGAPLGQFALELLHDIEEEA